MASVDQVLELLDSEKRRHTLYYLEEQSGPVSVDELAEAVADMETDAGDPSDETIRRYEVDLHHSELPQIDEASFVEYDPEDGVVNLTDEPPEFEAVLSVARVTEKPL